MSQQQGQRFVPSGVNAESWIGFEARIQQRRFRALLDAIGTAIDARDAVSARVALEEARELRPDAPELAGLEARVAAIPIPVVARTPADVWSRPAGAVALLLTGVALLIGVERLRPVSPVATPAPISAPAVLPDGRPGMPPMVESSSLGRGVLASVRPGASLADGEAEPAVGTAGVRPAIRTERPASRADTDVRPAARPPAAVVVPAVQPRETPDDLVVPQPEVRRTIPEVAGPPEVAPRGPAVTAPAPASTRADPAPVDTAPPAPEASAVVSVSSVPTIPTVPERSRVAAVLDQYARAYGQLDASAARAIWPSVDERALARAFADLASQNVAFDNCDIDVRGVTANASCRGRASYVGRVGSGEPRIEQRQWRFELRRDEGEWKIQSAEARRQ